MCAYYTTNTHIFNSSSYPQCRRYHSQLMCNHGYRGIGTSRPELLYTDAHKGYCHMGLLRKTMTLNTCKIFFFLSVNANLYGIDNRKKVERKKEKMWGLIKEKKKERVKKKNIKLKQI